MIIHTERVRALRAASKLTLKQLAAKSKVSVRQLVRLESESTPTVRIRKRTLGHLAEALSVEQGVLTGANPMPPSAGPSETSSRVQVSALLYPESRLHYALIKRRYGVNPNTIFNIAPLLFVLLAEGSLAWRRDKLAEVDAALDRLVAPKADAAHLRFLQSYGTIHGGLHVERQSIESADLFGEKLGEEAYDAEFDPETNNPFADYLRMLARKIDAPDAVQLDPGGEAFLAMNSLPKYEICTGELRAISGGAKDAEYALTAGYVRLGDIPEELWAKDATERRARWLAAKIPEDDLTFTSGGFAEPSANPASADDAEEETPR